MAARGPALPRLPAGGHLHHGVNKPGEARAAGRYGARRGCGAAEERSVGVSRGEAKGRGPARRREATQVKRRRRRCVGAPLPRLPDPSTAPAAEPRGAGRGGPLGHKPAGVFLNVSAPQFARLKASRRS